MPRDKTASHERIVAAAVREFREKGYEQASMKSVADAVGMTSAALYRHFASKQDMFAALVQPAVDAVAAWTAQHVESSYEEIGKAAGREALSRMWDFDADMNDARMVLDVMYARPDAFYLLLFRSAGTPYASCVHDMIEQATDQMMTFVADCKAQGCDARDVTRDEMHMLVTAYYLAMIEPLEHGYSREDAERYLRTIIEFFTPGWRMITGL